MTPVTAVVLETESGPYYRTFVMKRVNADATVHFRTPRPLLLMCIHFPIEFAVAFAGTREPVTFSLSDRLPKIVHDTSHSGQAPTGEQIRSQLDTYHISILLVMALLEKQKNGN